MDGELKALQSGTPRIGSLFSCGISPHGLEPNVSFVIVHVCSPCSRVGLLEQRDSIFEVDQGIFQVRMRFSHANKLSTKILGYKQRVDQVSERAGIAGDVSLLSSGIVEQDPGFGLSLKAYFSVSHVKSIIWKSGFW